MNAVTAPFLAYDRAFLTEEGDSNADLIASAVILLPGLFIGGIMYLAGAVTVAYAIAGAAFVITCFVSPQVGLYAFFAFQALDDSFAASKEAWFTPAKALGPFLIITWIMYLGRRRTNILISKPFIACMMVFGLFGVVTSVFAIEPLASLRYSGQVIIQVLILAMAIHVLDTRRYVARAMVWTVIGGIVASIAFHATGAKSGQFNRATLGEFANPNATAAALCISIAAIPAAWSLTKVKLLYPLFIAAVPLSFVTMLMCGTRAALVAIIFAFSVCIIFSKGGNVMKRVIISGFLLTITIVSFKLAIDSGILGKVASERLQAMFSDTGGLSEDSRLYIWQLVLKSYALRPLFGWGYGDSMFANAETHGWTIDVHNDLLGPLIDGGPIALALWLAGLWLLFKAVRTARASQMGMIAMILMVIPLICGQTQRLAFTKWFWVPVTLCLLLAEQAERERRREAEAMEALMYELPSHDAR